MKNIGLIIITVVALIVFVGTGFMLADYFLKIHKAQSSFSTLIEEKENADEDKYHKMFVRNPDMVGWIKIKETKVDYPVMQTKNDPQYYLHRDFNKKYSTAGTPFMDSHSDIDTPTFNWLIYGHHMRAGTMFQNITKYKSESFYKKHKTFTFDTVDENGEKYGTYEVMAACYSKIYTKNSNKFKYYQYAGKVSEDDFYEFVDGVKALSEYETGVDAEYGDQLITLSTCSYHTKNGRFFIVGKKVDSGGNDD